jgi:hypothetical protein
MTKKLRAVAGAGIIAFGLLLSGCEMGNSTKDTQEIVVPERPGVTIRGKVVSAGSKFSIQEADGKVTEVTSRKVDLKSLVGKEVELYGEFSGSTLYVDESK